MQDVPGIEPESGQHKHRSRHPVQDKASGQLD